MPPNHPPRPAQTPTHDDAADTIGIVGLGRVGLPVAQAFTERGYHVYGFDLRDDAMAALRGAGGHPADSPADVGARCSTVLILVLNGKQVIDAVMGPRGVLAGAAPGSTVIGMSTIGRADVTFVAEQCARRDIRFIDCPFTGGPARIPTASLTLIAAAPPDLIASVSGLLGVIGRIVHVGDAPGLGQAVKHCNQLLVGCTHAATMEVITLARHLNLDAGVVCEVVGSGIAGSDYFRLLADSVLNGTPSPGGLGQMCKDVAIVSQTVEEAGMAAYAARAAARYFKLAEELGMKGREGADLIEVVERTDGGGGQR